MLLGIVVLLCYFLVLGHVFQGADLRLCVHAVVVLDSGKLKLTKFGEIIKCHEFFLEIALVKLSEIVETEYLVIFKSFLQNLSDLFSS